MRIENGAQPTLEFPHILHVKQAFEIGTAEICYIVHRNSRAVVNYNAGLREKQSFCFSRDSLPILERILFHE